MMLNTTQLIRLHSTPGIGAKTFREILRWIGDDTAKLAELFTMEAADHARLLKLKPGISSALLSSTQESAETLQAALEAREFKVLIPQKDYLPPLLYAWGKLDALYLPGIGFSGARNTGATGLQYTAALAEQAVAAGYTVISGHAGGVDRVAHQTALSSGGITVLVLPEGVLKFKLHADLRPLATPENTLILSEFPPQMSWSAGNAMQRNQTIIQLAKSLCVIEAGDQGGTLNAGQTALKLGKPLFVLDYTPAPNPAGNTLLLGAGAVPILVANGVQLPAIVPEPKSDHPPTQLSMF